MAYVQLVSLPPRGPRGEMLTCFSLPSIHIFRPKRSTSDVIFQRLARSLKFYSVLIIPFECRREKSFSSFARVNESLSHCHPTNTKCSPPPSTDLHPNGAKQMCTNIAELGIEFSKAIIYHQRSRDSLVLFYTVLSSRRIFFLSTNIGGNSNYITALFSV